MALFISCGQTHEARTRLEGQWFGYSVMHCPDSIHTSESDTLTFVFMFAKPDSGWYNGYIGTDIRYPMMQGRVKRDPDSDTIRLERIPVALKVVRFAADSLRISCFNKKNGCCGDLTMKPFVGSKLPQLK